MLWVYAENDHFFSLNLAKKFLAAFNNNSGKATLIVAEPFGQDGHLLFSAAGIVKWTPIVDEFLKSQDLIFN